VGSRAWAGDEGGRLYLLENRGGALDIHGPVPSMAAHLPELSLIIYAAVAFGSIALGFPYLALAAMLAAIVGVPVLAIAVRMHYIRGGGSSARLISSEPIGRRVVKLVLEVDGDGSMALYANAKDVSSWIAAQEAQPLPSSSQ
jgi:hypothetical protein